MQERDHEIYKAKLNGNEFLKREIWVEPVVDIPGTNKEICVAKSYIKKEHTAPHSLPIVVRFIYPRKKGEDHDTNKALLERLRPEDSFVSMVTQSAQGSHVIHHNPETAKEFLRLKGFSDCAIDVAVRKNPDRSDGPLDQYSDFPDLYSIFTTHTTQEDDDFLVAIVERGMGPIEQGDKYRRVTWIKRHPDFERLDPSD